MILKIKKITSLSEFKEFTKTDVLPLIQPGTLILLEGEVGAGKTELVKTLCEQLGLENIQSPTFAFHHVYASPKQQLHHVDLYRAQSEEDLESTGFWDLFENTDDTILIEWSNQIANEAWPWGWKKIRIRILKQDGERREIQLSEFA